MQGSPEEQLPPPLDRLWRKNAAGGKRSRRRGLTLDVIVEAAVELADADGLEFVSMARLAERLGFTTMALYRHVRSKDELVALMVEEAAALPAAPDEAPPDWRAGLSRWSWKLLDVVRRHPWLLDLSLPRIPFGPRRLAWLEDGLRALEKTALSEDEKAAVVLLLNGYVFSEARLAAEVGGEDAGAAPEHGEFLARLVDTERFPSVKRALEAGIFDPTKSDSDEDFAFGLERILDGVERLVEQRAREGR